MPTLALKTETAHLLFQSGRFEVLLGPPGSGKTRLLRILAGLHARAGARAYAGGVEVTRLSPFERGVRYVAPDGAPYPGRTVRENLEAPAVPDAHERARHAAELFGLASVHDERADCADALTRRLLALAKAAVSGAGAVLLDDPFAALVPADRDRLVEVIGTALLARERIVVVATASAHVAELLGGGLHVLDAGAVLQRGTVAGVQAEPLDERVAGLVHAGMPVWPARVLRDAARGPVLRLDGDLLLPLPAAWERLAPGPYRVGVPARALQCARRRDGDVEMAATVEHTGASDGSVRARVLGCEVTVGLGGAAPPPSAFSLWFDPNDALLFSPQGRTLRLDRRPVAGRA